MGKTQVVKAELMLKEITDKGERKIPFEKFIITIKRTIGSDMNRTVKPYFSLMEELNLIEAVENEGERYVIIL